MYGSGTAINPQESSKQEARLCALISKVRDNPYSFAVSMFPWGKSGTPLEKYPNGPDEVQAEILKGIAKAIQENNKLEIKDAIRIAGPNQFTPSTKQRPNFVFIPLDDKYYACGIDR